MINWKLRQVLDQQGVKDPAQLSRLLKQTLNVSISRQALGKIMGQPQQIKLQTMQYLVDVLQVPLDSILVITPNPPTKATELIKPYGKQPYLPDSVLINPDMFL